MPWARSHWVARDPPAAPRSPLRARKRTIASSLRAYSDRLDPPGSCAGTHHGTTVALRGVTSRGLRSYGGPAADRTRRVCAACRVNQLARGDVSYGHISSPATAWKMTPRLDPLCLLEAGRRGRIDDAVLTTERVGAEPAPARRLGFHRCGIAGVVGRQALRRPESFLPGGGIDRRRGRRCCRDGRGRRRRR
jgi:hypothetical protein